MVDVSFIKGISKGIATYLKW